MPEFEEIFLTAAGRMLLYNLWQGALQRVKASRTQLLNLKFEHELNDNIITEQPLDVATMCMFVARQGHEGSDASTKSWHTMLAKQVSTISDNSEGGAITEMQSAKSEKALETTEHSAEVAKRMKMMLSMDAEGKKSLREKKRNGVITTTEFNKVMDSHTSKWKVKGAPNVRVSARLVQDVFMGAPWRHASRREAKRTHWRQRHKDDTVAARLILDVGADEYGNRASLGQSATLPGSSKPNAHPERLGRRAKRSGLSA